jgi:hypothetical protein
MGKVKLTPITEDALKKANEKATLIANAPSAVMDANVEGSAPEAALRLLFKSGEAVVIPTRLIDELEGATDAQLKRLEISPLRDSIGFPDLDVHIYIPGLLVDLLSPLIRSELARQAGRKSTAKKAAAVRENGKKGGRRKKKALAAA